MVPEAREKAGSSCEHAIEELTRVASALRAALGTQDQAQAVALASHGHSLISSILALFRQGDQDLSRVMRALEPLACETSCLEAVAQDGRDFCGWLARIVFGYQPFPDAGRASRATTAGDVARRRFDLRTPSTGRVIEVAR